MLHDTAAEPSGAPIAGTVLARSTAARKSFKMSRIAVARTHFVGHPRRVRENPHDRPKQFSTSPRIPTMSAGHEMKTHLLENSILALRPRSRRQGRPLEAGTHLHDPVTQRQIPAELPRRLGDQLAPRRRLPTAASGRHRARRFRGPASSRIRAACRTPTAHPASGWSLAGSGRWRARAAVEQRRRHCGQEVSGAFWQWRGASQHQFASLLPSGLASGTAGPLSAVPPASNHAGTPHPTAHVRQPASSPAPDMSVVPQSSLLSHGASWPTCRA